MGEMPDQVGHDERRGEVPRKKPALAGRLHRLVAETLLHALAVGAVGGVDGDDFAGLDEEGNHDLGAGLQGDFLQGGSGGGVALHGGLAVGDFEGHVGGELAGEAALLGFSEEHHLHALAFLHQVGVLHDVVGKGDLLVGLFVHEVEGLAVIVEILVRTAFDGDGV